MTHVHIFFIVVNEHPLLVNFDEALAESVQNVTSASVVRQGEHAVVHIERCLVTVADFEAFFIPSDHFQFSLQPFHVSVDV